MKIQNEFVQALQQSEAKAKQTGRQTSTSFDELLAQETDRNDAANGARTPSAPPLQPSLQASLLAIQEGAQASGETQPEQSVMDNVEHVLDEWENYAHQIEAPAGQLDLRGAYATLERISSSVKDLKGELQGTDGKASGLHSLVNELEIMAATEKIKFNRGDYLA